MILSVIAVGSQTDGASESLRRTLSFGVTHCRRRRLTEAMGTRGERKRGRKRGERRKAKEAKKYTRRKAKEAKTSAQGDRRKSAKKGKKTPKPRQRDSGELGKRIGGEDEEVARAEDRGQMAEGGGRRASKRGSCVRSNGTLLASAHVVSIPHDASAHRVCS